MIAVLSFQPVFLYLALGLAGIVGFSRVVLGWALQSS